MHNPIYISILGGGPAGLAAGYYAAKGEFKFTIYEASNRIGGNCATLTWNNFRFDLGAHRFHDKDEKVTQDISHLLKNDLHKINIPSQIYYNDRLINFPLAPLNLIRNMRPMAVCDAGMTWLMSRLINNKASFRSFESLAIHTYGKTIAERFLLNYSEKLWGLPCNRLSPDISGKRLKGLNLTTFLMEAFTSKMAKAEHLDGSFYYPEKGFGEIVERMGNFIGSKNILTNSRVTRIYHKNNKIDGIEINNRHIIRTNHVISTLPLPMFVHMMEPAPPEQILTLSNSLSFRSLLLIVLFLNVESVTQSGTVYFPGFQFPFTRVSEPKNRGPFMSPPGKTSLIVEIPCSQDEKTGAAENHQWTKMVCSKLNQIGWIEEKYIIHSLVHRVDYAYPVLEIGHEKKLERILDFLNRFTNLKLIGRNSLFKYTHFHDMMRFGSSVIDEYV